MLILFVLMRILGIDPGSVVCGYGVVELTSARKLKLVEFGVVEAKRGYDDLPRRLALIYERLSQVLLRTSPDVAAFEQVFYAKNVQSLLKLSQARGVAMMVAGLHSIPVAEYSALQVKQCVTGRGRAGKEQVQFMVMNMLGIKESPSFYDATDALAVAITHALRFDSASASKSSSWEQFIKDNPGRVVKK